MKILYPLLALLFFAAGISFSPNWDEPGEAGLAIFLIIVSFVLAFVFLGLFVYSCRKSRSESYDEEDGLPEIPEE